MVARFQPHRVQLESRRHSFDLYQKPSSGAGREELLLETGSNGVFPTSWSSDGRFLLYTTAERRDSICGCSHCPVTGSRLLLMDSIANETQARFSGDGLVAYTSDETGTAEVFVQPFPGTGAKWQVSTGGGSDPQWRRDGRELFYVATDGTLMAAPISAASTFEIGTPQALFQTRRPITCGPLFFANYAPAADGQRFLVNMNHLLSSTRRPRLPGRPPGSGRRQSTSAPTPASPARPLVRYAARNENFVPVAGEPHNGLGAPRGAPAGAERGTGPPRATAWGSPRGEAPRI